MAMRRVFAAPPATTTTAGAAAAAGPMMMMMKMAPAPSSAAASSSFSASSSSSSLNPLNLHPPLTTTTTTLPPLSSALPQQQTTAAVQQQTRGKYSARVLDHYNNPRNVGKLDETNENVVTGMMGAAECGDMMKIGLQVNPETGVIEDAKFKAFGCGSAIAASSFATEAIRGQTLAQAMELTNKDIAKELSLPPVKLHCSMLAEETIRAAVTKYLKKRPELKTKVSRKPQQPQQPQQAATETAEPTTATITSNGAGAATAAAASAGTAN